LRGGNRRWRYYNLSLVVGGDIIVSVNDKPVGSPDDMRRLLEDYQPGQEVQLGVMRGARKMQLKLTWVPQSRNQGVATENPMALDAGLTPTCQAHVSTEDYALHE